MGWNLKHRSIRMDAWVDRMGSQDRYRCWCIYIYNYIDIHMYVCVCEVCMFDHVFRTVPPAWITEMAIDV